MRLRFATRLIVAGALFAAISAGGVIAALLSQGLEPFTAAAAGVWLHAQAGRQAARRVGCPEGVIATDVIGALPAARVQVPDGQRGDGDRADD